MVKGFGGKAVYRKDFGGLIGRLTSIKGHFSENKKKKKKNEKTK